MALDMGYGDDLLVGLRADRAGDRLAAVQTLAKMREEAGQWGYAGDAVELFDDPEPVVAAAALTAVGLMGEAASRHVDEIAARTSSDKVNVKLAAVKALGNLGPFAQSCSATVEKLLDDSNLDVVAAACQSLGSMGAASAAKKLVAKTKAADTEVVVGATTGLGSLGAEPDTLVGLLSSKQPRVQAAAITALSKSSKAASYAGKVTPCLGKPDGVVRVAASNFLSMEEAAGEVPAITKLLSNSDAGVKAAAAMALAGIGPKAASAVDALEETLSAEGEDGSTVAMAVAGVERKAPAGLRKPCCGAAVALGQIGPDAAKAAPKLAESLTSPDLEMRVSCLDALGKMGGAASGFQEQIEGCFEDPCPNVVAAAMNACGALARELKDNAGCAAKLAEFLENRSPTVKAAAVSALGKMGYEATDYLETIVKLLNDPAVSVQTSAIEAVANCDEMGQMYASMVCVKMFDDNVPVRLAAVKALTSMEARGAAFTEEMVELLNDPEPAVRLEVVKAMETFGKEAVPFKHVLMSVADGDSLDYIRSAAQKALASFTLAVADKEGEE